MVQFGKNNKRKNGKRVKEPIQCDCVTRNREIWNNRRNDNRGKLREEVEMRFEEYIPAKEKRRKNKRRT